MAKSHEKAGDMDPIACDPHNSMPTTCAEAFQRLAVGQGKIETELRNMGDSVKVTNGHIENLYIRMSESETDRNALHIQIADIAARALKFSDRLWTLFLGLATGVGIAFLVQHLTH
jgi:hypothetical protein